MFADRNDAGQKLSGALESYRAARPLILGLPRGGVIVAAEVARGLGAELDVILVKKLRAPDNPELAIGAICEDGKTFVSDEVARLCHADAHYIRDESRVRLKEMASQKLLYRRVKPRLDTAGRTVILVDDGLATGATMIAAIQATALNRPAALIVAVPVGPPETVGEIKRLKPVQAVVCLETPAWFAGVGQFYDSFPQIEDEAVVAILEKFA